MGKSDTQTQDREWTRRQHLEFEIIMGGTPWWEAKEAVSSVAIEHPEWDMDETFTFGEWESQEKK